MKPALDRVGALTPSEHDFEPKLLFDGMCILACYGEHSLVGARRGDTCF